MAEPARDPHDPKVQTVPLPPDGDVIAQENQSAEVAIGGGEWPSPEEPPRGPSPGEGGEEPIPAGAVETNAGTFEPIREVLEADPVAGGSSSVPDDDDEPPRAPASLL